MAPGCQGAFRASFWAIGVGFGLGGAISDGDNWDAWAPFGVGSMGKGSVWAGQGRTSREWDKQNMFRRRGEGVTS